MLFDTVTFYRVIGSIVSVLVIVVLSSLLKGQAKRTQKRYNLRKSRYFAVRRAITLVSLTLLLVAQILIWGLDIRNLWVSITGLAAMTAVAFLAVWSLIGNILAGFLLYFTAPFKIDDCIEVLPDKIRGRVLAINTFFTVLNDDNGHYVNIPNSMLFQKYIINYRHGPMPQNVE